MCINDMSFQNILRSCGYDGENVDDLMRPMFGLENTEDCLNWICNNVGPQNVLTAEEVEEYNQWEANNMPDNGDVADSRCQEDDAQDITESIEDLREEIQVADTLINCLAERKLKLRSEAKVAADSFDRFEEEVQASRRQLQNAELEFGKLVTEFDSTHSRLIEKFASFGPAIFNATDGDPRLIAQMHREDVTKRWDECSQVATRLMKQSNRKVLYLEEEHEEVLHKLKYFQSRDTTTNTTQSISQFVQAAIDFKDLFIATTLESLAESVEVQVVSESTDYMLTCLRAVEDRKPELSLTQLKYSSRENEDKRSTYEALVQESFGRLLETVQEAAEGPFQLVLVNKSRSIEQKLCRDLIRVKTLDDIVERQVILDNILWLLLTNEQRKLNDNTCILQEYCEPLSANILGITEQRKIMQNIESENAANEQDVPDPLRKILKLVNVSCARSFDDLFTALNDLASRVKVNERVVVDGLLQTSTQILTQSKKNMASMERCVMSGGTRKPMISNVEISSRLHVLGTNSLKCRDLLRKLFAEITAFQQSLGKKASLKDQQLFWIYFLTNVTKMEDLINSLKRVGTNSTSQ